jgi:elongation factor Ts
MEVTAKMVKELRTKTGAGMMDCKKVLGEAGGDSEKAIVLLRERGIAKAGKKEGRTTAEGMVATYIHPGAKLGVMVEINCETDFVARTEPFQEFARNIAMHVAASSPACVNRDEVDGKMIEQEREIFRQQALKDGKPEKIIDKIVEGRIEKYYSEVVLMEQPFVRDADKTVGDYLKETIGSLGENMLIKRFTRFRLGE